ncbi:hypothetical protein NA78x_005661 [Anatilimnocola sp. NA78]|uniref:hypothetical protein n=1 Tax=Anatilimnocola sp. NA78 TaxID=3415683 RepID=UPI003CE4B22D
MTNRAPLIVAIVLLLLPLLYVGSYLALVNPRARNIPVPGPDLSNHYGRASRWGEWVYWPLEQIDRKVRPGPWQ